MAVTGVVAIVLEVPVFEVPVFEVAVLEVGGIGGVVLGVELGWPEPLHATSPTEAARAIIIRAPLQRPVTLILTPGLLSTLWRR